MASVVTACASLWKMRRWQRSRGGGAASAVRFRVSVEAVAASAGPAPRPGAKHPLRAAASSGTSRWTTSDSLKVFFCEAALVV